ncbi:hypothetical protein AcV7_008418 [Taiwanofungus camphoratus]|nr:hypothetical protein AcV7_008418 [Antrodia cinnamomea]
MRPPHRHRRPAPADGGGDEFVSRSQALRARSPDHIDGACPTQVLGQNEPSIGLALSASNHLRAIDARCLGPRVLCPCVPVLVRPMFYRYTVAPQALRLGVSPLAPSHAHDLARLPVHRPRPWPRRSQQPVQLPVARLGSLCAMSERPPPAANRSPRTKALSQVSASPRPQRKARSRFASSLLRVPICLALILTRSHGNPSPPDLCAWLAPHSRRPVASLVHAALRPTGALVRTIFQVRMQTM